MVTVIWLGSMVVSSLQFRKTQEKLVFTALLNVISFRAKMWKDERASNPTEASSSSMSELLTYSRLYHGSNQTVSEPDPFHGSDQLYTVQWLKYLIGRLVKERGLTEETALKEVFLTDFYKQLSSPDSEYLDMRLIDLCEMLTNELDSKGVVKKTGQGTQ